MQNRIVNKNIKTNNVITCDNITICKQSKTIIKDFNYSFEKGKIYSVIGNSGVGKTTLMLYISAIYKTKYGNIFIKDKSILGKKRKIKQAKQIRKHVGIVFQFPEYQLFKDTVEKDIAMGPINNHVNKDKALKLASKYSYLVGLNKKLLKANPFDLSNGQKRLVTIAGVLAINPDIIIFDEPIAGLDPFYQKKVINIIKRLAKQGKTIIIVTHDMDRVLELSNQVLVLDNKRLIASGDPYKIFTNNKLINKLKLDIPHVIQIAKQDRKILSLQPRTLNQLVSILKGGN